MLVYRGILAPLEVCSPYDPAIDAEAWTSTPEEYLSAIATSDADMPLPPVKPGEKLTVIVLSPLDYSAYEAAQYLIQRSTHEYWAADAEVQRHILRHSITDIREAYTETDGDRRPVRVRTEEGPYGRRLTAEAWESVAPFAGSEDWAIMALATVLRTRRVRGASVR